MLIGLRFRLAFLVRTAKLNMSITALLVGSDHVRPSSTYLAILFLLELVSAYLVVWLLRVTIRSNML